MCVSAFICHHNSFLIYGSLEEPTLKNWSQVTHMSVSLALVISVVFAACGYMTFTGYTEGKLLDPSILVLATILTFLPCCLIFFCKHLGDCKNAKTVVYLDRNRTFLIVTQQPKQDTKMSATC